MKNTRKGIRFIIAILLLAVSSNAVASPISDRMMQLLKQGKMVEVYRLGLKHVFNEGGNADFDFAFGIAAVRVGRPGRAIFALERVLWRQPDNHRARLELARAQFDLGNLGSARDEFLEVLEHNPPENVRKNVEIYLAKIKQRERSLGTRFRTYVEGAYVYDTNLNAATSSSEVAVPALGWVTLDPGSTAQSGSAYDLKAGFDMEMLMSKRSALFGGLTATSRTVPQDETLSTLSVDVSGGLMFGSKKKRFRLPGQVSQLNVAGQAYRQMAFAGMDYTVASSVTDGYSVFAQTGLMSYPTQTERNVLLGIVGGSWTHRFGSKGHSISLSGHYGQEQNSNAAYPQWGRNYYGVRSELQWRLGATDSLYANVSYQLATHGAPDPVFIVTREDQLIQFNGGWKRKVGKSTVLEAKASYTSNNTNIDIYTYNRTQVSLGAKYQF